MKKDFGEIRVSWMNRKLVTAPSRRSCGFHERLLGSPSHGGGGGQADVWGGHICQHSGEEFLLQNYKTGNWSNLTIVLIHPMETNTCSGQHSTVGRCNGFCVWWIWLLTIFSKFPFLCLSFLLRIWGLSGIMYADTWHNTWYINGYFSYYYLPEKN